MPKRKQTASFARMKAAMKAALRGDRWSQANGRMIIPHNVEERRAIGRALMETPQTKIYGSALGKKYRYTGTGDYAMARYSGMGDYDGAGLESIVDNSLVGQGVGSAGIPSFGPEQSEYRITKTEFLRKIYAPTVAGSFQNLTLPLQPGLEQTFPWLALVSPQFNEYEFLQLMFYWRPMVSDFNSGTGQVGEVVMVTQYNPDEAVFTDASRAKNYMGAMSTKSSIPMNHGVECNPSKNSGAPGKYVRVGPLSQGQDLKQYDLGTLNVIVTGTPPAYSDQVLGELWVAYTVILRKPKLPDSSGEDILRDYFQNAPPVPPATQLTPIAMGPSYYGQQNRLNGPLEWQYAYLDPPGNVTTGLCAVYDIPAWYSGELDITVTLIGCNTECAVLRGFQQLTGNVQACADLGDSTSNPAQLPIDLMGIYPSPRTAGWSRAGTQGVAAPGAGNNIIKKVRIKVSEAANGLPNRVGIWVLGFPTASPPPVTGWSVDVTEYNSSFNSPTTGHILLTDVEGAPVQNNWVFP